VKNWSRLDLDGILTGAGRKKWYESTIIKILKNEMSCENRKKSYFILPLIV